MESSTEQKNLSLNKEKDSSKTLILDLSHPGLLVLSLFSISCCCPCLPFGYVSLYYAFKIGRYEKAGDTENAKKSSYYAKLWAIINIGVSLLGYILYLIIVIIASVLEENGMLV